MIKLQIEKMEDIWKEAEELAWKEYEEIERGKRPFAPDYDTMITLNNSGTFKVLTARRDGILIGYLSWMIDFDMESKGTLIVQQGAWYVEPGHFGVASKMFNWAIQEFKRLGVEFVYWHTSIRGRGVKLGKFFENKGCELTGCTYTMDLRGMRGY